MKTLLQTATFVAAIMVSVGQRRRDCLRVRIDLDPRERFCGSTDAAHSVAASSS